MRNKKLPLILIPRSLPKDRLIDFVYLITLNKFPFAKLVVEHYEYPELIISDQERYVHMEAIEVYIKATCAHSRKNYIPYGNSTNR